MADVCQLEVHGPGGIRHLSVGPDHIQCRLTELIRRAGLTLNARCGERRLCQGCMVEHLQGRLVCLSSGDSVRPDSPCLLRACDYRLADERVVLRVPQRSLLAHAPQVVSSFRLEVPWTHDPLWQRRPELGHPVEYRGESWVRSPLSSARPLGVAIDIGTTTVVVGVVELTSGEMIGQASALNAQAFLGDNVLTRVHLCQQDPLAVGKLQRALVEDTLSPLLEAALTQAGCRAEDLVTVAVAGNTIMLHLLAGVDPASMGVSPFTPTFLRHRRMTLSDVGLGVPNAGQVSLHLLPGAGAYVGADVVAGVLASGLCYDERPSLLLDLGTNGEMVLQAGRSLWGCATAAGPAFEGAGLSCGVRAGAGAITHVWPGRDSEQARFEVIGGGTPIGLCGTAYIDFIARARKLDLLTSTGRFTSALDAPTMLDHRGRAYVVAKGRGVDPIVLTEADVAVVLQAKAAIAAGVCSLLDRAGLISRDIGTVFLAGGFGFHMHIDSLLDCGLLPGFTPEQVQLVGNTSLAGAYASLLDSTFLEELGRLGDRVEIVELNLDPAFESSFIDHLGLP